MKKRMFFPYICTCLHRIACWPWMATQKTMTEPPGRGLAASINRETHPPGWQALDKKGNLRRWVPVPSPCCGVLSAAGEGCWREQVPRPPASRRIPFL
jgi:hypothetical protein